MKKIILALSIIFSISNCSFGQTYTLNANLGTINTCTGTFVDGGGSGSDYSSSSNYTVTFCSGSSAHIKLTFSSFITESGYDHLYVYDGPTTGSPLVDDASGSLGAFTLESTGSCLTINFTSDGSIVDDGWVATISCVVPCVTPTAGGVITNQTTPVMVCPGEVINFSGASSVAGSGFSIVSYVWDFDDATTGTGVTTSHSYATPGQYVVNLDVTDNNGCHNANHIDLVVQVGTTPVFTGTTGNQTVCAGQNVCLNGVITPTAWQDVPSTVVSGTTPLPDGSGVCYDTPLTFTEFGAGQTITSANQIQSVYASIEHTFVGDLVISLICPSGGVTYLSNADQTWDALGNNLGLQSPDVGYLYSWPGSGATYGFLENSTSNPIPAGSYTPEQPYSNLIGCPLNGTWTLRICDTHTVDDGTIFYWGLNFDPSVYSSLPGFTPTFNSNCTGTYWGGINSASTSAITSTSADCNQICVTPPSAGTYTYTFTGIDNFGCTYNTTTTVTATPGPTVTVNNPTICNGSSATLTASGATTYNWSNSLGTGNPVSVNPSSSATYTVTGTTSGCTGTASASVTVNPTPTATLSGSSTICVGSSGSIQVTLTGTGPWSFTYNDGTNHTVTLNSSPATITVNPAATTTYNAVSVSDVNCSGTASGSAIITVNPAIILSNINTVCNGPNTQYQVTFNISGGNPATYSVTPSGTITPGSPYTFTSNWINSGAAYSFSVTDTYNCSPQIASGTNSCSCPATGTISGNATICNGNNTNLTFSLTGTAPWSIIYSDGTNNYTVNNINTSPHIISVAPSFTTTYTLSVVSDASCTGTASGSAVITVNQIPVVTATPASQSFCTGGNTGINLTSTVTGTTFNWTASSTGSITGFSNGSGNSISQTLANSGTSSGTVIYAITPTANSCIGTPINVIVTVNPIPQAEAGSPQTICNGQTATLTASGGVSYIWDTGQPIATISVNPSTTTSYLVTVTDINGCSAIDVTSVNVNPIPVASASAPQSICPLGTAILTANGGSSFLWDDGSVTQSISVSPTITTTYTVTVSNNGCTSSASSLVTVVAAIIADAGSDQTICDGQSANLTANGGTIFAWSNGGGTQTISVSPVATNSYTVTVSSGGCSGTDDVTVNVNPLPTANAGTDQIICSGQSANLTAFGGISYSWSNSAQTQSSNVSPAVTTTYIVTVTDANNCSNTDNVQVTVNPLPIPDAGPDQSICTGEFTNLAANGGNGYSWSPTAGLNDPLIANPSANPTSTTNYSVTVTDVNGCTAADQMMLTVNNLPNVNAGNDAGICQGQSTQLSASGGTNYSWNPTSGLSNASVFNPSANPSATTTYIVTATDINGCSNTDDVIVTVNNTPTSAFTVTSPICFGTNSIITYNGTASSGANYNWNFDGGTIISGSGQGPYEISWPTPATYDISLTVTENNCSSVSTTIPVIVDQVVASLSVTNNISCYGFSDGEVTVSQTGTGPFTYNWNPAPAGTAGQIASGLSANISYSVTVTDSYGCEDVQSITLTQPSKLSMSLSTQNALCFRDHNGSASATVTGGTPTYTYTWLPSGTALNVPSVNTLSANNYSLTVTDSKGCNVDTNFTITEPSLLTFTYTSQNALCNGNADGSISISPSGGSSSYTYLWTPSVSSNSSASGLSAGSYNIIISDLNSCDTSLTVAITQPDPIVLSTTGNITICNGQNTVIGASATGGSGGYVFTWDNGLGVGSSFTVNPLVTTTYTVNVTDINGCTGSPQTLTVSVSPAITVTLTSSPGTICDGENTTITATANGGNGNYTYTWDNSIGVSGNQITVSPTQTTTYIVTVTDNCNSPAGTDDITIVVNPLPTLSFSSNVTSGCEPLVITFTDNSTPAIQSWVWNFGDPASGVNDSSCLSSPTHTYLHAGNYSVTLVVATTNGCTGYLTQTNMIEVYPTPIAAFNIYPESGSTEDPTIYFTDYSSNAAYWNWNFGDDLSTSNTSDEPNPQHNYENSGTFTVWLMVESAHGCVDSTSKEVFIKQDFALFFPNAFTPNSDGDNDGFRPDGYGVDLNNYELYIFDRWGSEVFRTNDFYQPWNGKVQTSENYAEIAVYTWICNVKDVNGEMYMFNGRVTLVR